MTKIGTGSEQTVSPMKAAEMLDCKISIIRRLIKTRQLEATTSDRKVLIPVRAIEEFRKAQTTDSYKTPLPRGRRKVGNIAAEQPAGAVIVDAGEEQAAPPGNPVVAVNTDRIVGVATALTPIVHSEVLSYKEDVESKMGKNKGRPKRQRTMPFILSSGRNPVYVNIPVVSGNAMRGLMRRLLVDFSLETLGIRIGDIIEKPDDAHRTLFFIRCGGVSDKGTKPERVPAGTYDRLRRALPFLSLLGGAYQGHHFEGSCKVGILIPLTQETYPIFKGVGGDADIETLPRLDDLRGITDDGREAEAAYAVSRYTRRGENEKSESKESMIYAFEQLPAGTRFFSFNSCTTDDVGTRLAFKAMFALLAQYGCVGGMSGRGHGRVEFDFNNLDASSALQEYAEYLAQHKDSIIAGLRAISTDLLFTTGAESNAEEGAAGNNTAAKPSSRKGQEV